MLADTKIPSLKDVARIKIIIVGNSGVGKTTLLKNFLNGGVTREKYGTTVGTVSETKIVSVRSRDIPLTIWDTAGEEKHRCITPQFYRNSAAVLVLYDVTNRQSFDDLTKWLLDVKTRTESTTSIVIIGNKSDLSSRVVTHYEGCAFADRYECVFRETSALNDDDIVTVFEELVIKICDKIERGLLPTAKHGVHYNNDAPRLLLAAPDLPKSPDLPAAPALPQARGCC
ncbi:hypothetical protein BGZ70_008050 [Mortierella alpina]|uniref:Uncharacterized protein n=1 Tax=Mortierella alpina TaxID=64518 RepID=A0A9P6JDP3_MORAP|nr:hypothetical protein BGZ70_008050 [Mortierella alpina]